MKTPTIISFRSDLPDPAATAKAVEVIRRGGLLVFPTGSFYALGAAAFDGAAVRHVFDLKRRDFRKPLLILIPSLCELAPLVIAIPDRAKALMQAFWPGGLTLVFDASDTLPPALTGRTGKIGIRMVRHPVARAVLRAAETPLTGTSANVSGQGGCTTVGLLAEEIISGVDLILDAGPLPGGPASTVVDVTQDPPVILRPGAVPAEAIRRVVSGKGRILYNP